MDIDLLTLLAAFGGGIFGAALGATPAFIFTGIAVLIGVAVAAGGGGSDFLTGVAFGPFFGPHTSFAGAVAAAAYAAKRGFLATGRDGGTALMGLNRPDVLAVGGAFSAGGYLIQHGFDAAALGPWTDTIALTVVTSGVIARLAFGSTGLLGKVAAGGARFTPTDEACYVRWQETPGQLLVIGLGMGLSSAYAAQLLGADRGGDVVGFGIAAASLVFIQFGSKVPVSHHIALPAAVATLASGNLFVGAAFGIVGAFVGEFWSRAVHIHGDTHIDPPAAAIATSILIVRVLF